MPWLSAPYMYIVHISSWLFAHNHPSSKKIVRKPVTACAGSLCQWHILIFSHRHAYCRCQCMKFMDRMIITNTTSFDINTALMKLFLHWMCLRYIVETWKMKMARRWNAWTWYRGHINLHGVLEHLRKIQLIFVCVCALCFVLFDLRIDCHLSIVDSSIDICVRQHAL